MAKKSIPTLPQHPYNPDLAPCDFYLFPELKLKLKGHHYGTVENIRNIVTGELSVRFIKEELCVFVDALRRIRLLYEFMEWIIII